MKPSTRIVLNTLATYGRSLFALAAGLFTARWTLQALGQVDYGLYGVVGSSIILMTFLNGGMSVGVARFYAYSIGRGQHRSPEDAIDDLKHWFNTAFLIHLVLPVLLIVAAYPLGIHAIRHWMTIPADRIEACVWVFRITLITAFVNMASVPFVSMYVAHQYIAELSLFGVLTTCCTLLGAYCLLGSHSDRLVVYAFYMMAICAGIPMLQIARAFVKFKACRLSTHYMLDRARLRELFHFVGWKTFGMSCVVLRAQGCPLLINLHFGPVVNAAYSVANSLSSQATDLSGAMMGAFQPALVAAEGSNDRQRALTMAMQVCKFGTLLVLFFAIPLILEMDNVLTLWLGTPPVYAGRLCQWMLAMLVVDRLTAGPMLAVNARGKIAAYELVQGTTLLLALPLIWLFFMAGATPVSVGYGLFITMGAYCLGRLGFAKRLVQFPLGEWVTKVALPTLVLTTGSLAAAAGVTSSLGASLLRVGVTVMVTAIVTAGMAWVLLLDSAERSFCIGWIRTVATRLGITKQVGAPLYPSRQGVRYVRTSDCQKGRPT